MQTINLKFYCILEKIGHKVEREAQNNLVIWSEICYWPAVGVYDLAREASHFSISID